MGRIAAAGTVPVMVVAVWFGAGILAGASSPSLPGPIVVPAAPDSTVRPSETLPTTVGTPVVTAVGVPTIDPTAATSPASSLAPTSADGGQAPSMSGAIPVPASVISVDDDDPDDTTADPDDDADDDNFGRGSGDDDGGNTGLGGREDDHDGED